MPCPPMSKACYLPNWANEATTDWLKIREWAKEGGEEQNCACVAKFEGYWFLDCDDPTVYAWIERSTGKTIPDTYTVRSGSGIPGKGHLYWQQTAASRFMGNIALNHKFECKVNNAAVIAAGSIHPDTGKFYKIMDNLPIVPAPDWLVDFLLENSNPVKERVGLMPTLDPNFDIDDYFRWWEDQGAFHIVSTRAYQDSTIYIPDHCIIAGDRHRGSSSTGFRYSDNFLGYRCWSPECEEPKISDVHHKLLDEGYKKYPHRIWAESTEEFDWEVEDVDD